MSDIALIYAVYGATVVAVGTVAYFVYAAFTTDLRDKKDDW